MKTSTLSERGGSRLGKQSAWPLDKIQRFLGNTRLPVRIATMDDDYPLICSLWFRFDARDGALLCACHKNSRIVALLRKNPKCGFEVAQNEPPYRGVRGKADVALQADGAGTLLAGLIDEYLGDTSPALAEWLLGRADDEYVLRLTPVWMTAWDYSPRMNPAA